MAYLLTSQVNNNLFANGLFKLGGRQMKRYTFLIVIIGLIIGTVFMLFSLKSKFNSDFATDIYVKYKYGNQSINEKIQDASAVNDLKTILNGNIYIDNPSCGFSVDISITLSNSEKTVVLYPALDGCPIIRIDETDKFLKISNEDRKKLDAILKEYGFKFPSI